MATLKEQLQSKVDSLGVGYITPIHTYSSDKLQTIIARVIFKDPRIYKPIFCLKELGIDKSLKAVVLEVRDSVARIYYILDSSCFFINFDCDYQTLELVKELPMEVIHYLRILSSKKGRLELIIREDNLYLLFEDTFPSKMPAKERKEKEVDKYVLSIPLKEVDELDKDVIDFVKEVVELEVISSLSNADIKLPVDLNTITLNKEPIDYYGSERATKHGNFTIVDTSGINATLVICPVEVSIRHTSNVANEVVPELNIKEVELDRLIPDLDYSSNYEEDIKGLNDAADLVNDFIGELDDE